MIAGPVPEPLPPRQAAIHEAVQRYVPLGREGDVDDVAGVAFFLCSRMAAYVTWAAVPVDGGTWARVAGCAPARAGDSRSSSISCPGNSSYSRMRSGKWVKVS